MAKRKQTQTLTIVVAVIAVASLSIIAFSLSGQNLIQGNFVPLSLAENPTFFRCDAWNELAVTKNGVVSVVGSGRQGFNPSFDTSFATFDITDAGVDVSSFHVRLVLECKGYNVKYSTATTVEGSMNFQLCAELGRTVCFVGDDRTFANLKGSLQEVQTFSNVPIQQQSIQDSVPKIVYEGDISAQEIERLFGGSTGSLFMKSTMFPALTFTFNHPTKGVFQANYNGITANQPIYAQYGGLQITPVDTDKDGIPDTTDGCINQPETVNGFQDEDGCPDVLPPPDADADGIPDANDQCIMEPETVNGFQDEDGCPDDVPPPTGEVVTDTDRDGVPDQSDLCPTTIGTIANAGCPEPQIAEQPTQQGSALADDDGDGTLNAVDKCPNQFGSLSNAGCPELKVNVKQPVIVPPPIVEQPVPQQTTQAPTTTTTEVRPPQGENERNLFYIILIIAGLASVGIVARFGKIKFW